MRSFVSSSIAATAAAAFCLIHSFCGQAVRACDHCYGPTDLITHERRVRRMQPGAQNTTEANLPRGPLEWGQINFLHTTDTHGWLEGHIKEQNYGADWGDFVSFVRHMKKKAADLNVDLLLIDTGDLHDGNGLSDATTPNGIASNAIFKNVQHDLATPGNHELYLADVSYLTFANFTKAYGDRYLASNVQIVNPTTGALEDFGAKYRYFQTPKGLNIMAFGVIFDFTGNSNATKITPAATMVKEQWFIEAVQTTKPVDLFILIGHNPVRSTMPSYTWPIIYGAIRAMRPDTPIQGFGGHTHFRSFVVYDPSSTALESGRYCETLGWLSMSGIASTTFNGSAQPADVPNPSRPAIPVNGTTVTPSAAASKLRYSRRYLDWNRLTFAYHADTSQDHTFGAASVVSSTFDTPAGLNVTRDIATARAQLNLTQLYGCAPQTWCISCAPFGSAGNIYSLLQTALATVVVNRTRAAVPRLIIVNTGSVRFDLVQGPFTYDDSFIVSPFTNTFQFLADVPYELAIQILPTLNAGSTAKKSRRAAEADYVAFPHTSVDTCHDPGMGHVAALAKRSTRGLHRRQAAEPVPGYTTTDDFGTDGDDTPHSPIPEYPQPGNLQAMAGFPTDGSTPATVDLVITDFLGAKYVVPALQRLGANYTAADLQYYLPKTFTTNDYLPEYARVTAAWQEHVPNCPVGKGVGF